MFAYLGNDLFLQIEDTLGGIHQEETNFLKREGEV